MTECICLRVHSDWESTCRQAETKTQIESVCEKLSEKFPKDFGTIINNRHTASSDEQVRGGDLN